MDGGACDFTFTFHFHALEKEMETHSSVLAWKVSWTEEPGGLKSMMSQRFKKDRVTKTFPCLAVYISKGYNLRVVD